MRTLLEQLGQDLRYALRMIGKNPAFTALAALSLALGIGANTAIYSFMDAILMRSLPVQNPEALALVQYSTKDFPGRRSRVQRQQFSRFPSRVGQR